MSAHLRPPLPTALADRTVAILGLGLLGGSLARDLAARGTPVLGYDADPTALRAALAAGTLLRALSPGLAELAEADLLVLAVPVPATRALLEAALPHLRDDAVVTDVGSTKRSIQATATALGLGPRFVGAHPLAGDHRRGWDASRTGLFRDAPVFLCPAPDADAAAVAIVRAMWQELGADARITTAEAHDALLALTSHLPQLAAFALAHALAAAGTARESLGPGGRDTLRLAASPAPLWAGIALDNADHLLPALARLRGSIALFEDALRLRDEPRVTALFSAASQWYSPP